jgi:hypothetical protein
MTIATPGRIFVAGLLCLCASRDGLLAGELPVATATRLAAAPVVDGELGDAGWATCPALELRRLGSATAPTQRTEARIGYDDRALYVSFRCFEDQPEKLVARVKDRDGDVFQDDCVEFFLAPHAEVTRYYHFLVNLLGTQRDDVGADPAWNATWQSGVARQADGWSAELAIPFDQLGLQPDTPPEWRLNFSREELPHGELSSWAPCQDGFHQPQSFGSLRGLEVDLRATVRPTLTARRQALDGRLAAVQGQPSAKRARELLAAADTQAQGGELKAAWGTLAQAASALERAELEQQQHQFRQAAGDPQARFVVCAESSLVKVRGDRMYKGTPAKALSLSLARREYEPLQLVVISTGDDLKQCRVAVSPLVSKDGGRLEAADIAINVVGFVRTQAASGGAAEPPGLLPDPLLPDQAVDIPAAQPQPFWLTVYARPGLPAATYAGAVTVTAAGCPPLALPLAVRVFGFELPVRPALRTCFLLDPGAVASHYNLPGAWAWSSDETNYVSDPNGLSVTEATAAAGKGALTGQTSPAQWVHFRAPVGGNPQRTLAFDYRYESPGALFVLFGGGAAGGRNAFFAPPGQSAGTWQHAECKLAESGVEGSCSIEFVHDNHGSRQPHTLLLDNVRVTETTAQGERLILAEDFERGLPRDQSANLTRNFRLNLLAHRISDCNVAAPQVTVAADGGVTMDWSSFDQEIGFYRERGLTGFNLNWLRIGSGWGDAETAPDEGAKRVAAELCRQTQAHLEAKGWIDDGYIYTFDEPGVEAMKKIRPAFDFVHQHAPRLRTLLTFGYGATRPWLPAAADGPEAPYAALEGAVDIWVPHIDCADFRVLDRQRARPRNELWHYVCIAAQKPYPNLWGIDYRGLDHRLLSWQLWRYQLTGTLYWAVTYWKENVWENPLSYPGGNGDGSLYYWVDGVHALAGSDGKPDTPVNSIRLELTRDGIEDYDYFALLRQAAATAKDPAATAAQRLLDLSDLTPSFTQFCTDPALLVTRREQVGLLLEQLQRRQ